MTENEIIIAYGTETGNAEMLAEDAANAASDFNLEGRVRGRFDIIATGEGDTESIVGMKVACAGG